MPFKSKYILKNERIFCAAGHHSFGMFQAS